MTPRPEPKRDRWSRYLLVPPDGGERIPFTRVTTVAGTLDDRWGLERWRSRKLARGLALRSDLLAQVVAAHDDDRDRLDRLCDEAVEAAAGSAGANLGSALHALTERVDAGEVVDMPDHLAADVAIYNKTLAANGIIVDPEWVERIVVLDDLQVAGTVDRLVRLGSRLFVADLKTGQSLEHGWLSIAQQLALYSRADAVYDVEGDVRSPMPDVDGDTGLVVHLPAGKATCSLWWVDLAAGWEAVQCSLAVRGWRGRKDLAETFTVPADDEQPDLRSWLVERIGWLRVNHPAALADLAASWPAGVPTFKQSEDHDAGQLEAIRVALVAVEAAHQLPFADQSVPDSTVRGAA